VKAGDVMTTNVVTVGPKTSVRQAAEIMLARHISAVPVVGQSGELLGIVSEGDLVRRAETKTERHRSWWLELLSSNETLARDFVKSHSARVTDIMTTKVVTTQPEALLGEVAALLERNGIKRVPIVKDGKVVGIVSRANLLQALASARPDKAAARADDSIIREKVLARLKAEPWVGTWPLNIIVHDATVELWGLVESEVERMGIRVTVEQTEGVRSVNDNLVVRPLMFAD
jgi:CBS domain-containing protein